MWTNLIHNALQATQDRHGVLGISVCQRDGNVVVSVSDTGCGIPQAIRDRIFDPFFTTKPRGEGSGLGLDIARKIVEKHHGHIDVQSEEGVGATFSVVLPVHQTVEAIQSIEPKDQLIALTARFVAPPWVAGK